MTFPILASLLVRLVVLLPFQLLRLSRSEERFSRNAETDIVCRLLLEKKNALRPSTRPPPPRCAPAPSHPGTELVFTPAASIYTLPLSALCTGLFCRHDL